MQSLTETHTRTLANKHEVRLVKLGINSTSGSVPETASVGGGGRRSVWAGGGEALKRTPTNKQGDEINTRFWRNVTHFSLFN